MHGGQQEQCSARAGFENSFEREAQDRRWKLRRRGRERATRLAARRNQL